MLLNPLNPGVSKPDNGDKMISESDGRYPANRCYVMATCLTSERHGGVLAALSAGAATIDEIADSLPAGTGRERLTMLLSELHDAGFVERSTKFGAPSRVWYQLTRDGRKLVDLTTFVGSWLSSTEEDEIMEPSWSSIHTAAARASAGSPL